MVDLASSITPNVFAVEPQVFASDFQSKETNHSTGSCTYLTAYPVSKVLSQMQPPFLILDELESPRNIGQILRTAVHLGVTSVVASRTSWESLTGRAARSSMGWMYHVDFALAEPLSDSLRMLRELGIRIYAAENHFSHAVAPHQPAGDRRWALVVGSESVGISKDTKGHCDAHVSVPQRGGESLNVGH